MIIEMGLHQDGNLLLLDSQDIYEYVGENTAKELEIAYYIDKWCAYLNYPLLHNDDMKFGDTELSRLEGWIDGYNYAKQIRVEREPGNVKLRYGRYHVVLPVPFCI